MAEANSTVVYKDIPGHPGYRVSDTGEVWSCWVCVSNGQYKGTRRAMSERWHKMKQSLDSSGYPRVTLIGAGRFRVHRLVLLAFVGPCPPGMECCHNDGNHGNPALSNLRWDTPQANQLDRARHGTSNRGERNGMNKFSEVMVRRLRARHAEIKGNRRKAPRGTPAILAAEFGLTVQQVHHLTGSQEWRHVGPTGPRSTPSSAGGAVQ